MNEAIKTNYRMKSSTQRTLADGFLNLAEDLVKTFGNNVFVTADQAQKRSEYDIDKTFEDIVNQLFP